jgi:hypothetical protein
VKVVNTDILLLIGMDRKFCKKVARFKHKCKEKSKKLSQLALKAFEGAYFT